MLLGRPWQYDRRMNHDGYKNRYSFKMGDQTYVLGPLSPKEVHEDQIRLSGAMEEQKQREAENFKKKKEKEKEKEAKKENENKGPKESHCTSEQEKNVVQWKKESRVKKERKEKEYILCKSKRVETSDVHTQACILA